MYHQFRSHDVDGSLVHSDAASIAIARASGFDALAALEQIGTRRSFTRDEAIYTESDLSDCWYKVVSGTVRTCKLLADGRRHIAEFCFPGDCFGLPASGVRIASAEAVGAVVVMRYPQRATDRLIDENPRLVRGLYDRTLRELIHAQTRMLQLGRMTASERVASFLLEVSDRHDTPHALDLPMSRNDVADYLGLTIETVCRVLSGFRRNGVIAIPMPYRIELRDREVLEALCEA
jgi:CRP/FNR family transcriptional regulator, nitrogen fixation regulation protein